MRKLTASLFCVVVLASGPLRATCSADDAADASKAFASLQAASRAFASAVSDGSAADRTLSDALTQTIVELNAKYLNGQAAGEKVTTDYAKSVAYDAQEIQQGTATLRSPGGPGASAVTDAEADLEVKIRHADNLVGLSDELGIATDLRIVTFKNGQPVSLYIVALNPHRWANSASPLYTIVPPSDDRAIPPGHYRIRLMNGDNVISFSVASGGSTMPYLDLDVGIDGQQTQQQPIYLK